MRQVVLDTETTGLSPTQGHRIIEIGCIELNNRRLTGKEFHSYLQPDRAIDYGATQVHGITNQFLTGKPRFKDIVDEFKAFIKGAQLIIHNAPFDVGFIENEFTLLKDTLWHKLHDHCDIFDTLPFARKKHPGQRNNLDALCKRYGISVEHRDKHGALLDAKILSDLYLSMTGGQNALLLDSEASSASNPKLNDVLILKPINISTVIKATPIEAGAHQDFLKHISEKNNQPSQWKELIPEE